MHSKTLLSPIPNIMPVLISTLCAWCSNRLEIAIVLQKSQVTINIVHYQLVDSLYIKCYSRQQNSQGVYCGLCGKTSQGHVWQFIVSGSAVNGMTVTIMPEASTVTSWEPLQSDHGREATIFCHFVILLHGLIYLTHTI